MTSVSRGNELEHRAKRELEASGYLVERPKRTRFNAIDFFGCFDLIAVPKQSHGGVDGNGIFLTNKPRFIQVTVKAEMGRRRKLAPLLAFPKNPGCYCTEVWGWDKKLKEFEKRDYSIA